MEHLDVWEPECRRLGVPRRTLTGQASGSSLEPFTREGAVALLQEFVVGDDLVRLQPNLMFLV